MLSWLLDPVSTAVLRMAGAGDIVDAVDSLAVDAVKETASLLVEPLKIIADAVDR